jgi:hypothetical protein
MTQVYIWHSILGNTIKYYNANFLNIWTYEDTQPTTVLQMLTLTKETLQTTKTSIGKIMARIILGWWRDLSKWYYREEMMIRPCQMGRRNKGQSADAAFSRKLTDTNFASWTSVSPSGLSLFMTCTNCNRTLSCSLWETHLNQISRSILCYCWRWWRVLEN